MLLLPYLALPVTPLEEEVAIFEGSLQKLKLLGQVIGNSGSNSICIIPMARLPTAG